MQTLNQSIDGNIHYCNVYDNIISALKLPCPPNITVFWNGGSLLGMTVGIQIATGLILRIRYNRDSAMAFAAVLNISRERDMG